MDRTHPPSPSQRPAGDRHPLRHALLRDGTDEWFRFCGVTSHRHGAHYPHEVLNRDPTHPIMENFGPGWANPDGELYWIEKLWPTAHPLASAKNRERGTEEVCVWTNQYGQARVVGTTLGHNFGRSCAKVVLLRPLDNRDREESGSRAAGGGGLDIPTPWRAWQTDSPGPWDDRAFASLCSPARMGCRTIGNSCSCETGRWM